MKKIYHYSIILLLMTVTAAVFCCGCSEEDQQDIKRALEWQNNKEAAAEKASKEVLTVLDKLIHPTEDAATRKQYLHPDIQEEVEVDLFILLNNIDSCRVWPDRAEVVASGEMFESPQKIYFQYQKGKWIITKVESE